MLLPAADPSRDMWRVDRGGSWISERRVALEPLGSGRDGRVVEVGYGRGRMMMMEIDRPLGR